MTSCSCPTLHILLIKYLPLSLTTTSQLQLPWSCGLSCSRDTLPEEYKLVNIPARRTPVILLCCGVNRIIVRLSSSQTQKTVGVSLTSLCRVLFLRVFFFLLFCLLKQVLLCLFGEVKDFIDLGTTISKKSYHHLGVSPMWPNENWTCPDEGAARAQAPDCQLSSCGSVRRGTGGDRYSQRRS